MSSDRPTPLSGSPILAMACAGWLLLDGKCNINRTGAAIAVSVLLILLQYKIDPRCWYCARRCCEHSHSVQL